MTVTGIKKLLKTRNLRATELRVALLEIISNLGRAVSYKEIQNSLIKFDRITLYRTLNSFIERGILHKIILEDNKNFYALCNLNALQINISIFIFSAINVKRFLVLNQKNQSNLGSQIIL